MTTQLTDEQRKTLNDAEQIMREFFDRKSESFLISFHAGWKEFSICYFTPNKVQHSSLWQPECDNTFADKIAYALELRADEDGRADQIKAERVEKLREELAALTGDADLNAKRSPVLRDVPELALMGEGL